MKKIALLSLISSLSVSSFVCAGEMGNADSAPTAFVSLEGGYTWNKINGLELTNLTSTVTSEKKQSQTSVRLAAGVISMIDDQFGITGELGWGYYGQTTFNFPVTSVIVGSSLSLSSEHSLYGFDALVGASFIQTYYSLYFKVGGLIQNMQQNNSAIYADPNLSPYNYSLSEKQNSTQVLPALKLGAAYNIDSNWSITGSYLLAYGATTGTTVTYTPYAISKLVVSVNTQNPKMNTFMLGVQYAA
jgi:hypothetical protein